MRSIEGVKKYYTRKGIYKMNQRIRKKEMTVLTAILLAAVLTACGSANTMNYTQSVTTEAPAAVTEEAVEAAEEFDSGAGMSYDMEYTEEGALEQETVEVTEAAAERKLIKTVNISTETEQFDILVPSLQAQVERLGGYIEEMSVYQNGSYYDESREKILRGADMTARIPKEHLDSFLMQVGEQSNVVSQSERVEDVTLQYVDLDSHKRVLVSEQERLIELLEQAETVEDIIAIEGRLSEVRYQIESMESQLRTYDNKIDYSTVYLSVREVKKYTPPQDITIWEKIGNGFVNSLEDIGNGICDFFVEILIDIPYLVLGGIILVVSVLIIRQICRVILHKLHKSGKIKSIKVSGIKLTGRSRKQAEADSDKEGLIQEDVKAQQTAQEEKEEDGE